MNQNDNLWMLYDFTNGKLKGFYTTPDSATMVANRDDVTKVVEITKKIHTWIFDSKIYKVTINIEMMKDFPEDGVLDDENYFIITEPEVIIDIDAEKSQLISKFKGECGRFIVRGLEIELSDGSIKQFSYKTEDQINLKLLIDQHKSGDMIYYHADGEIDTYYSYEDIVTIFKALYNNKLFNQIYTQVACQWIIENYTLEVHNSPDTSIEYGYSNDWIFEKMEGIYNEQKLL